MTTLYVGLDMAKDSFSAARWHNGAGDSWGEYSNDAEGFEALSQKVRGLQQGTGAEQVHVTLEPTGGYERRMVTYAHGQGWRVSLPNPKLVRDWAKGLGQRAKTDKQDALVLAHYGADREPLPQGAVPENIEDLDCLLHRQKDLEKLLRQERNRLGALEQRPRVPPAVRDSLEKVIESLEEALAEIEESISRHVRSDAELHAQLRDLQTVPGIGQRNAPYVLVLNHRWWAITGGRGTAKGLTAYVGLDPRPCESGRCLRRTARISKMGDTTLRCMLYLGALGGTRGHNPLHDFYHSLVDRGKAKKVALIAAAHKILVWAWAVFCSHSRFDPGRMAAMTP